MRWPFHNGMKRILLLVVARMREIGIPPGLSARAALIVITGAALALGLRVHPISAGGFPAAMAVLLALETLELIFALAA